MIANVAKDAGLKQTTENSIVHRDAATFARIRRVWPDCGRVVRICSKLQEPPIFRLVDEHGRYKQITHLELLHIKGG